MLLVALIPAALLAFGLLVWLFQGRLVFLPHRELVTTPAAIGLEHRDLVIETADGEHLAAWWVTPPRHAPAQVGGPVSTVLFLHGNAGNISHRGATLSLLATLGLHVLLIDYRGYGASTGEPSEAGLYTDAEAAWRWLTVEQRIPAAEIVLFGRSLGGAVAVELAARVGAAQPPAGLIIESGFDRLASLARVHYPLLARLIPLRLRFPAAERIGAVACPVLILHSPDDEIAPIDSARRLFAAAPQPKTFVPLEGGHNDAFLRSQPGYQRALAAFLSGL